MEERDFYSVNVFKLSNDTLGWRPYNDWINNSGNCWRNCQVNRQHSSTFFISGEILVGKSSFSFSARWQKNLNGTFWPTQYKMSKRSVPRKGLGRAGCPGGMTLRGGPVCPSDLPAFCGSIPARTDSPLCQRSEEYIQDINMEAGWIDRKTFYSLCGLNMCFSSRKEPHNNHFMIKHLLRSQIFSS